MNSLTLISCFVLVSFTAASTLDVKCGDPKTDTSAVLTYSGEAVAVFAYGPTEPCEFIDNLKTGTRMVEISYTASDKCSFQNTGKGPQSYSIKVESRMLHKLFESGSDEKFLVDCNFLAYKSDITIDADVDSKFKAPEYKLTLGGNEASSDFEIFIARASDNTKLTGPIKQTAIVNLQATMTAAGGENAYMPIECTAEIPDGSVKVHVLASGCGTGFPWETDDGFTISGVNAKSPNFRMFRVSKTHQMVFRCSFVICEANCDGKTCIQVEKRRRRRSITDGLTYNSLGLISSDSTRVKRAAVAVSLEESEELSNTGIEMVNNNSAYALILSSSAILLVLLAVGLLCASLRRRKIIYTIENENSSCE